MAATPEEISASKTKRPKYLYKKTRETEETVRQIGFLRTFKIELHL